MNELQNLLQIAEIHPNIAYSIITTFERKGVINEVETIDLFGESEEYIIKFLKSKIQI
jgi:hypothetical protein